MEYHEAALVQQLYALESCKIYFMKKIGIILHVKNLIYIIIEYKISSKCYLSEI